MQNHNFVFHCLTKIIKNNEQDKLAVLLQSHCIYISNLSHTLYIVCELNVYGHYFMSDLLGVSNSRYPRVCKNIFGH